MVLTPFMESDKTLPPLGWASRSVGTSTRPLDTLETFFKLLSDSGSPINREHWAVSLSLKINFPPSLADPAPYLRRAWLLIRRLHPTIAGSVTDLSGDSAENTGSSKPILTVGPLDADAWLSQTFVVQGVDGSDAVGSVPSASDLFAVMLRTGAATCHWLPISQEVFIRAAHWRIDGIGMVMLGHSFLSALASVLRTGLDADLESYETPVGRDGAFTRSLDDLADAHTDEASTPAHITAAADALVADFIRGVPSIALPTLPGSETAVLGDSAREVIALDASTTAAVISACKARGISVSSAVHAALVRVTATYPQHPLAKSYASFFPVDMRRHLPKPYDSAAYAVGVFCSGLPVCVSGVLGDGDGKGSGKSFDEISKELAIAYSRDLSRLTTDDEGKPVSMLKMVAPYVRRTTQLFATPPPPELPPVQNPDMSSLGKIEEYIQRSYNYGTAGGDNKELEVVRFWLGTQMLARSLQCHVWTFRDELTIQGCYNVSFYDAPFVRDVLRKIELELLTGLGVQLSSPPPIQPRWSKRIASYLRKRLPKKLDKLHSVRS